MYKPAEDLNLKALTAYTDKFYDEPLSKHIDKIDLVDASGNVRTFDIKYVFTDERQSNQSAHDRFVQLVSPGEPKSVVHGLRLA